MTLELSADEVLTTTRSVRRRLDLEKEVSPEILRECLNIALQAPTGSLRQDWHFVVSTDRDQCREVGTIYQEVWTKMVTDDYLNASASRQGEKGDQASWLNMMGSARHLAETFPEVPAIFVPCISGRLEGADAMTQAVKWGSVIQAAWSFMLAARNRGLGTCWTTVHLQREEDVADILGIPFASIQQVALSPVAHTVGTSFKSGRRKPSAEFVHFNGW
ncbi:MAG TPA: nitroreductase [Acidimicrobiaceae bacterium]|nr:nitroreductase [Acidimicrobiaceae bacterium]|tara:strand:- start:5107 stop:5760 length:654 start_codon:yes stop_codon:yes gene_type:complete